MVRIYKGNIISSASYEELKVLPDAYIVVKDGFIEEVSEALPEKYKDEAVVDYGKRLIIPAFSDLHMHAPQYTQRGIGMDCLGSTNTPSLRNPTIRIKAMPKVSMPDW